MATWTDIDLCATINEFWRARGYVANARVELREFTIKTANGHKMHVSHRCITSDLGVGGMPVARAVVTAGLN
jgi:hypothetical protein